MSFLSKLCPSTGHRAAPPVLGTGTRYREWKAEHGHGKQWRGAGTEKGTKVHEKNMESHRLKITFPISLRFPCRSRVEELLPTCRSCGAWRQRGAVPEGGRAPRTEERGGRLIKYSLYCWQPSHLPLARSVPACSGGAPAGEGMPAPLTPLAAARGAAGISGGMLLLWKMLNLGHGRRGLNSPGMAPNIPSAQVPLQRGIPTFGHFVQEEEGIPLTPKDAESQHLRTWVSTGTDRKQENRISRISLGAGHRTA